MRRFEARAHELAPFDARYGRQLLPALDGVADARRTWRGWLPNWPAARPSWPTIRPRRRGYGRGRRSTRAGSNLEAGGGGRGRGSGHGAPGSGWRRARPSSRSARCPRWRRGANCSRRTWIASTRRSASIISFGRRSARRACRPMIIESAIPEVEIEANRLLARMSDNRMSLRLETQREKSPAAWRRHWTSSSPTSWAHGLMKCSSAVQKFLVRTGAAHRHQQAPRRCWRSAPDAGDRRGVRVAGLPGPVAGGRGDQLDPARLRADYRHHAHRRAEDLPARIDVVKTASGSWVMIA